MSWCSQGLRIATVEARSRDDRERQYQKRIAIMIHGVVTLHSSHAALASNYGSPNLDFGGGYGRSTNHQYQDALTLQDERESERTW
jgi:hypothetical protein